MADPFAFPDPFDRLNLFPRSRPQAAYPPLDDADTESQISKLTRGTLSGLGYVGSTLDKLTGARAIRGALGGKPRELLSILPGSDVAGLTDEADTVRGEDLIRQVGINPDDYGWLGRNVAGPALELAMDPSTYFGGIGALTRAGKAASKTAPVARSLASVRSGQRSLHPLVGAAEWGAQKLGIGDAANPRVQQAAADLTAGAGRGIRATNVGIRERVPFASLAEDMIGSGARQANVIRKSLFDKSAGPVADPLIQASYGRIKAPSDIAAGKTLRGKEVDLRQRLAGIIEEHGLDPHQADRFLWQYQELGPNLVDELRPQGFIGPLHQKPVEELGALAQTLKREGGTLPTQIETGAGLPDVQLNDDAIDYALRRRNQPSGGGLLEQFQNVFSGQKKLLPTTHPSFLRRKEALKNWEGGRVAIEDLMTPNMAGQNRSWNKRQINEALLQDQIDRFHRARQGQVVTRGGREIPIGPVSPDDVAAMRRRVVAMQRWLRTVPKANIAGGPTGDLITRLAGLPGDEIRGALARTPDALPERQPFFDPDPIRSALLRQERALGAAGSANTLYDVIGQAAPLAQGLESDVPVSTVLDRARLNSNVGVNRALQALGYTDEMVHSRLGAHALANQMELPLDPADELRQLREMLSAHRLPERQATAATKLLNRWAPPEELRPILALTDALQNAFKTGTYSIWPGSLARNIGSGITENLTEAGMSPTSYHYGNATQALAGKPIVTGLAGHGPLTPAAQREDLLRRAYVQGVIGRPQGEVAERVGMQVPQTSVRNPLAARETTGQILGQIPRSLQAKGLRGLGDIGAVGRQLGTKAEDNLRLAEFSHLLQTGHADDVAADIVSRTHFDYNDVSAFESAVMKRLVPFYTYPSRNLPKQLVRATQRPATIGGPIRFSGMLQGQGEGEGYVPEYLRSGLALPFGQTEPGVNRYLSALGLPLEEAFGRLKIGQNLPETIAKTGQAYLSSLRPGIRLPLEVASGKQFLTGRDLADLHVGKTENFLAGGNETTGRVISELAGASPASRGLSTLNRLLDERKYSGGPAHWAVAEILPLLSGLRVTDVDAEKWMAIDARNQLERELAGAQHVREFRDYYADRTARQAGEVTPQEAEMLSTYAALKLRAREAQQAQRRVGVRLGGG